MLQEGGGYKCPDVLTPSVLQNGSAAPHEGLIPGSQDGVETEVL